MSAYARGNQSGAMTRKPLRPSDYIAWHDQQKVEALKKRMEDQQAMNQKSQSDGARKRSAQEAQLPYSHQPNSTRLLAPSSTHSATHGRVIMADADPMIADTKKYLEMKRRKQAFEDFLLVKRLQKEKEKSEKKLSKLQKEFDKDQQQKAKAASQVATATADASAPPVSSLPSS
jgi:hypothetical protein